MGIQRYSASLDTTITNAYESNLSTRGTGSNMGLADVLEVFTIYGQESTSSSELSRILIQFPVTGSAGTIGADRDAGTIPASGSVNFFLRMYNTEHSQTLPKDFSLNISAIKRSWEEGYGLDMEGYTDLTHNDVGANWENAASGSNNWTTAGGDFYSDTSSSFTASFSAGNENIEVDITTLVEQWLSSSSSQLGWKSNYGVGVFFPSAQEGAERSYYTKKFFARGSQYYLKRPIIEARWDSSTKDNQGSFYLSSSLATGTENLNTIYMYNNIRGQLRNIPGISDVPGVGPGPILVSVYSGSSDNTAPSGSKLYLPVGGDTKVSGVQTGTGQVNITGGYAGTTGIYSASFAYASSSIATIFPVWHSGSTEYYTGSAIEVRTFDSADYNPHPSYVSKITNLRDTYSREEKDTRFRIYIREKDWSPNIYNKASSVIASSLVEDGYYKVYRTIDEFEVVAYGTGSANHTRFSYDVSGSYFDFPVDVLEAGYMYAFKFLYKMPDGNYREQPETFKFRVD